MQPTDRDRSLLEQLTPDLSKLFGEMLSTMRLSVIGLKEILNELRGTRDGAFLVFAGGGLEMPVQKNTVGIIRMVHNPSAAACSVVLLGPEETSLWGSSAAPVVMPAGSTVTTYIPFKNGFRATVTGGGYVSIGGDYAAF